MKYSDIQRRSGGRAFTMIELLVVIAIIAILSGLLLPAVIGGIKKGEITLAQSEVKLLDQALRAYQADFQKFPGPYSGMNDDSYKNYYYQLICTLRGSNTPGLAKDTLGLNGAGNWKNQNPRQRVYLALSDKSICTNGAVNYGAATVATLGDLMDPWGNRYNVVVDFNADGQVSADGETLRRPVAVWSWGPDLTNVNVTGPTINSHIRSWR